MSDVLDRTTTLASKLRIIDSDIHPSLASERDLDPFLSAHWRKHIAEYGKLSHRPFAGRGTYPRFSPNTAWRDAWPANGNAPGSDLDFMRAQLLDRYDIEVGILEPLLDCNLVRNPGLAAALCSAINDWQVAAFTSQESRLRASILIPFEDPAAAAAEIDRRAGDRNFAQIQLTSRSVAPIGQRRYWPIFEAAVRHGLPIGMHIGGESGHGARPMRSEWAESVCDQARDQGVAFFFKQWGAWGPDGVRRNKKSNGRELAGRRWDEYPVRVVAAAAA